MQYGGMIAQSKAFIETHLDEELSVERIAGQAGYSVYHFCRVFGAVQGVSVMEYVRGRRLARARAALCGGRRVTDVALAYGFETPSGFAKAFRKEFGYSPTTYLARMQSGAGPQPKEKTGGFMMQPVMKTMPAFLVAGYGIQTDAADGYLRDIGAYWEQYEGENLENKMYAQLQPPRHGEVGLCVPAAQGSGITYLFGVIVEDFARVTPDMMTAQVPAAEYAVFTTRPVDLTQEAPEGEDPLGLAVKELWKQIFEEWFPGSGYQYDDSKLDFEFYDERCHHLPNSVMDIYVPVKRCGRA